MKKLLLLMIVTLSAWSERYDFNPATQSNTSVIVQPMFNPKVINLDGSEILTLPNLWTAGIATEVPIVDYFKMGFLMQATFAIPGKFNLLYSLDTTAKTQYPIRFAGGWFVPYVTVPFGLTFSLNQLAESDNYLLNSPNEPIDHGDVTIQGDWRFSDKANPYLFGIGPNAAATFGVEYYPIPELGIYAEGGYGGVLLAHHLITKWISSPDKKTIIQEDGKNTWTFATYLMHGPIAQFGVRITL